MAFSEFLDYALRGFAVTAIGVVALLACYRVSASRRHLVAASTLLAVILLPSFAALQRLAPISIRIPAHAVPKPSQTTTHEVTQATPPVTFATEVSHPEPAHKSIEAGAVALWIVLGVGLALLARLALSTTGLRFLRANARHSAFESEADSAAREIGLRATPRVAVSADVQVPIALACIRSLVVLPEEAGEWTAERRRSVLLHEFSHVKRQDGAWQAIAEIACAIQWWNPLAWMLRRSVRLEAERAADDMVLLAGVRPAEYAADLVTIAKSIQKPVTAILVSPMARRTQIQDRVKAILMKEKNRQTAGKAGLIAVSATALLATGAIAAVKLSEETGLPTPSEPRFASAIKNDSGTSGTKDNGWTAVANDGRTAQVVEVIQQINGRKFAWKPDGTLVAPGKSLLRQVSFGDNSLPMVVVTSPGTNDNDPRLTVTSDGPVGAQKTGSATVDGKSYDLFSPSPVGPKDRFTFTVHVFDSEWQNIANYQTEKSEWGTPKGDLSEDAQTHGFRNAKVEPAIDNPRNGPKPGTEINCEADGDYLVSHERTMVAELADGTNELTLGQWGEWKNSVLKDRWYFDSPLSKIRNITLQVRSSSDLRFEDVAIRPKGSWPPSPEMGLQVSRFNAVSSGAGQQSHGAGASASPGGGSNNGGVAVAGPTQAGSPGGAGAPVAQGGVAGAGPASGAPGLSGSSAGNGSVGIAAGPGSGAPTTASSGGSSNRAGAAVAGPGMGAPAQAGPGAGVAQAGPRGTGLGGSVAVGRSRNQAAPRGVGALGGSATARSTSGRSIGLPAGQGRSVRHRSGTAPHRATRNNNSHPAGARRSTAPSRARSTGGTPSVAHAGTASVGAASGGSNVTSSGPAGAAAAGGH